MCIFLCHFIICEYLNRPRDAATPLFSYLHWNHMITSIKCHEGRLRWYFMFQLTYDATHTTGWCKRHHIRYETKQRLKWKITLEQTKKEDAENNLWDYSHVMSAAWLGRLGLLGNRWRRSGVIWANTSHVVAPTPTRRLLCSPTAVFSTKKKEKKKRKKQSELWRLD